MGNPGNKTYSLAFLLPAMRMGGAEKIFLNFLKTLPAEYKVTVILNRIEGELLGQLPDSVEIIEDRLLSFAEIVKSDLHHFRLKYLWRDLVYYWGVKSGRDSERNYCYIVSRTPALDRSFDCAVSYVTNVSTQIFSIIDRTNSPIKIGWIHGETSGLHDTELFAGYYGSFFRLFAVSQVTMEHFLQRFPGCRKKIEVYYNPIDEARIRKLSQAEDTEFDNDYVNIVSVGRISPEKGFDMVPEITRLLLERGHKIRWFIIGDGPQKEEIQKEILHKNLSSAVFLLGNKNNPYPYMNACDIYVQPSYEEGYSTTICEAGILGCAIIGTTTSGGIREQLENGKSGIIVPPEPNKLAEAVELLLSDREKIAHLKNNVRKCSFAHVKEIQKLNNLLK